MRQSVAAVADRRGHVLGAVRLPLGISYHGMPRADLHDRIWALLQAVLAEAGKPSDALDESVVCIGLTGVTFPHDAAVGLPAELIDSQINAAGLVCTGDAEIVFASHAQAAHGGAVLCHMGSTAYVLADNQKVRFGGWGPAFGDEGSGYWMGREALRAIGYKIQEGNHDTVLHEEVRRWLDSPDGSVAEWAEGSLIWKQYAAGHQAHGHDPGEALFVFAHHVRLRSVSAWRRIASGVTIPLMRAWDRHDEEATRIVVGAARNLAWQLRSAYAIAGVDGDWGPIVLYGGVLTHHPAFRDLLAAEIAKTLSGDLHFLSPRDETALRPALGALLLALGNSDPSHLRLPDPEVIDRVAAAAVDPRFKDALRND